MLELLVSEDRGFYQDLLAWSVCAAALIFGSGPERAVAATWLLFFEIAPNLYEPFATTDFRFLSMDAVVISFDAIATAAWIVIALYANRNYTLWIAGLQIVAITAHLVRGMTELVTPVAYATMVMAPGWIQLLLLAGGLVFHRMRLRQFGQYRDWSTVHSPSVPTLALQGGKG